MMNEPMSMLERLRAETSAIHARVEGLPFFAALQSGAAPRETYVRFLEAMATIHEPLEHAAATTRDPLLAACWDDTLRRLPLLRQDLAHFERERSPTLSRSLLHAILLAEEIALRELRDPPSLVGYLYVLGGSALGGLVLRPRVARAFNLNGGEGLAYLGGADRQTRRIWTAFTTCLNAEARDPVLQERVVDAALEAFEGIEHLIQALSPDAPAPVAALGSALNPEAGRHAIADDPREIRAALRAGVRSWERFPYYEWRYGRRGRRFTRSDSAWLVTLSGLPQKLVDEQIAWLGQLLAARGMPRWMLELHLETLHDELAAAVPERRHDYAPLLDAAHRLRLQRAAVFGDGAWRLLVTGFDAAVGPEWARRLPQSGGLLAAAVADDLVGVTNAIASLENWMADPTRFPEPWIAAVRHTLAEARRLAHHQPPEAPR